MQELSSPEGLMMVLAMDHRSSLADALGVPVGHPGCYETMRDFKLAVLEHLLPHATATLIDPQYVAADAIARGALPGSKGLIVTLEESGYHGEPTARLTRLLPNWSIGLVKRMGGSAAKLYLDYNPYAGEAAERQEKLVAKLVGEAHEADLPLLVEPISYSLDPGVPKKSAGFAARRPDLVVETVRRIGALGVDVLKVEFPHDASFEDDEGAWADACAALNDAAPTTWALLSAGVDYETFKRQVKVACQAGASGFVAGRAIWKEAIALSGAEREEFLRTTGAARMAELSEIAGTYARPWTAHYPNLADAAGAGWLERYAA
jgi:tagatose 1,6-diphosphate aldolase